MKLKQMSLLYFKKGESHSIHIEYETEVAELLTPAEVQTSSHTTTGFPGSTHKEGQCMSKV